MRLYRLAVLVWLVCAFGVAVAEDGKKPEISEEIASDNDEKDFFAVVGEQKLSKQDYIAKLRYEVRQKFFHAKVPDKEMERFREQVGEELINRTLLIREAQRQGIKPDKVAVDNKLSKLEKKKKDDENWQKNKERLLPGIREQNEHDSIIKLLEKKVRDVAEPPEKDIQAHFKSNPDKFTVPEQLRVATILLKVDPSSGSPAWQAATEEAKELVTQLRNGADFAEMARIHSSHDSAPQGGDMGYIHKGMLAKPAQEIIDIMDPGDISEPVVILQGVAIFRLDERQPAGLNNYEKVKDTAKGLVMRETGQKAWADLLKKLRSETKIEVDKSIYKVVSK
ncbi:MAG: hypothetical protein GXP08_05670 [Gammaproteobacteria bacterium]|nr:hypothetical protein [Gammaproteobacteria bacterium]